MLIGTVGVFLLFTPYWFVGVPLILLAVASPTLL